MGESIVTRILSRIGVALAALLLSAPLAWGQVVTAPTYLDPSGNPQAALGTICLLVDGTSCPTNAGGGGGPITAAANSFASGFSVDIGTIVSPAPGSLLGQIASLITTAAAPLAPCSAAPCTTQIGNVTLTDGAANTTKATIKAASTAPATTDTALVVTQSPNPGTSPCSGAPIPINQTASTDLKTFTNLGRLCSIYISNATSTQGWSLANGTGTLCATGINYLIGGAGGTTQGSFVAANDRTLIVVSATANHLCLIQSGSTNLSGFITFSDAP